LCAEKQAHARFFRFFAEIYKELEMSHFEPGGLGAAGSSPVTPTMKKDIFGCLFSVIFAYGKLYCYAVIFGLRRVILCFAQFNGKYNITETEGFNITFTL